MAGVTTVVGLALTVPGRGHARDGRARPDGDHVRSWSGVRDFVILVAGTPHAADRLTPAALQVWLRLLGVAHEEPGVESP
jgi:hypothetical protein